MSLEHKLFASIHTKDGQKAHLGNTLELSEDHSQIVKNVPQGHLEGQYVIHMSQEIGVYVRLH